MLLKGCAYDFPFVDVLEKFPVGTPLELRILSMFLTSSQGGDDGGGGSLRSTL